MSALYGAARASCGQGRRECMYFERQVGVRQVEKQARRCSGKSWDRTYNAHEQRHRKPAMRVGGI